MPDPTAPAEVYTHGHHESVLRSHRWRTAENSAGFLLAILRPDMDVLDVGCGPGTITIDLARRLPAGRVVGVDRAPDVLAGACAAAKTAGMANVGFVAGDVYDLHFADATYDVVYAHQVLQHLRHPVAALAEMRRVCRPGGVVAARDGDYPAMTWYPPDPWLDRWVGLYCATARHNGGEPAAGRRLVSWARSAGFEDIAVTASAWCFARRDERRWWGDLWADRITASDVAARAVALGLARPAELAAMADAWRRWAEQDDGWFAVLHGEILCQR